MNVVPASRHLERARVALSLAGRALDPNGDVPIPDLALGADLLCRALENALLAIDPTKDPRADLKDAVACLGDDVLVAAAGNRARALAVTTELVALAKGEAAEPDAVSSAERFVTSLVASAHRKGHAQSRWRRVVVATFALVVALVGAYAMAPSAEDELRFTASSGSDGYRTTGRVGDRGRYGVFLHTRQEMAPWVEIDLGRERDLSEVRIVNRVDCCAERALPLVVSVRTEKGELHDVARREAAFDTWEARFPTERARYVRLTVPRETILHLQDVHFK